MKSNEILHALKLNKSKETTTYCSKLASIFEFAKMVKDSIIETAIIESNLTIDNNGKILDFATVENRYKESLLSNYRYNNVDVCEITKKESVLRCEKNNLVEALWQKRKNKDNSILQGKKDAIDSDLNELNVQKEMLVSIEQIRLQSIVTDITEMRSELNFLLGASVMVETKHGNYSFYLPVGNEFYYTICGLLNLDFEVKSAVKKEILHKFIVYPSVMDDIKKAAKFVSKDDLRPAMQCICLDFSNEGLQIIATDANKMYYSQMRSFEGNAESLQILIAPKSVTPLSKLKVADAPLFITLFSDNTIAFNYFEVSILPDVKYPSYRQVIPQYDTYLQFDKAELIKNVKKVMPFANKATNQVKFHINGSIALHACDVDFSFESEADMAYISKNIPDTDIAFNGKMLIESLSIFKDTNVKMYSNGKSTQAGIFSNDTDNVLLMPLMLNETNY